MLWRYASYLLRRGLYAPRRIRNPALWRLHWLRRLTGSLWRLLRRGLQLGQRITRCLRYGLLVLNSLLLALIILLLLLEQLHFHLLVLLGVSLLVRDAHVV